MRKRQLKYSFQKISFTYIGFIGVVIKSIFVHDPIRFLAMGSSAFIENQSFPHSDSSTVAIYHLVATRSLPKTSSSSSICARSRGVFLVFVTEEVPIILRGSSYFASLCKETCMLKPTSVKEKHSKLYVA